MEHNKILALRNRSLADMTRINRKFRFRKDKIVPAKLGLQRRTLMALAREVAALNSCLDGER